MNRGADHDRIFHTRGDGDTFLRLLAEASERHGVEVHAYCLMPSHYHLVVRSLSGHLSNCMKHLSGAYTQYLNGRLRRDGAVFRGRFRSELMTTDSYVVAAVRYVHRNPTEIGIRADTYRWSSYGAYPGLVTPHPALRTEVVSGILRGDAAA